jgi:hypothetical protein
MEHDHLVIGFYKRVGFEEKERGTNRDEAQLSGRRDIAWGLGEGGRA